METKEKQFGKVASKLITDEVDESARAQVEGVEMRAALELGDRKSRRAAAALMGPDRRQGKQFAR